MSMKDSQIDEFLEGVLSEEQEREIRETMTFDEGLAARIGQRKVEMLVVEELNRKYWSQKIDRLESDRKNHLRIRRILAYAAAAAAAAIFFFWVVFPTAPNSVHTGPIAFGTDHNSNLRSLSTIDEVAPEMLHGKWAATIAEQPGLELNLELEVLPGGKFGFSAFYTLNQTPKTGDKITARGTYNLDKNQLTLALEEPSIKRAPGASPFETAPIELWLKTKRLFKQEMEIVGLDRQHLILKYERGEGMEWTRI